MASRERIDLIPQGSLVAKHSSPNLASALAELVLETMNEGVWLVNAEAVTTFVNRHTADLLGYSVEEMIGVHVSAFLDEEGRAASRRNLKRRRLGIEEQIVLKCLRKDGSSMWLLFCSSPLFDRNDNFAGSLGMVADFTKHKNSEFRHKKQIQELSVLLEEANRERSVAQKQAAMLQDELKQKRRGIVREVLATTTVVSVMGAAVASVAMLTAWGVVSSLRGGRSSPPDEGY